MDYEQQSRDNLCSLLFISTIQHTYHVMGSRFVALSDCFAELSYLAFEVKVYQPSCQNLRSSDPFKMIFINFKKQLPLNCTVHNNDIMCYIKVNA